MAQLDRGWLELFYERQRLLNRLEETREGWEPSPLAPSPPPAPRDAHVLGRRGSTQRSLCVCVCGLEAAEQTCMCEVLLDTASLCTSAFVSLNSLFLTVFYYCCFSNFIWVFWFLRTEIILIAVPIVSSLSSLILLTFWLICPSLHLPFPSSLCLLWLWEKLELKSSSLAVTELSCQNCVVY